MSENNDEMFQTVTVHGPLRVIGWMTLDKAGQPALVFWSKKAALKVADAGELYPIYALANPFI